MASVQPRALTGGPVHDCIPVGIRKLAAAEAVVRNLQDQVAARSVPAMAAKEQAASAAHYNALEDIGPARGEGPCPHKNKGCPSVKNAL